jgi:5-methyltetrahydrofolate--homocysteine methyltransferase
MGKEAVKEGAHMVDVCAAYVGRDERRDMSEIISRFNTQVPLPIVIDSTEAPVIEEALQHCGGKAVINSINLEDGEERIKTVLPLCQAYGAAVIALTIDEEGMAKSADRKLAIARRIHDIAVQQYGMKPHDLIFDMHVHARCDTRNSARRSRNLGSHPGPANSPASRYCLGQHLVDSAPRGACAE